MDTSTVDPVCGMALASWDRKLDGTHAGAVYHFCSPQCATRFAERPERYTVPGTRPLPRGLPERVTLPVFGLGCGGGGSSAIQRQLLGTPGVLWAYVNPATETAYIKYDSSRITHDDMIDVVEELGYWSLREERGNRDGIPGPITRRRRRV